MPTSSELIGLGLPPALANALGTEIATAQSAAGTTQATATLLTAPVVMVTTCAANAGMRLPNASAQPNYTVTNAGAGIMKVYPATGETLNNATANSPLMLPVTKTALFVSYGSGWAAIVSA